jgi:hypothetical protein
MDRAEFITVEQSRMDLILSFAIAPSAERSLVLLRSPPYELLLPEDERGISISMVPRDDDVDRDLLLSVRWEATRVELRSRVRTYVVDVSMVDKKEISAGQKLLQKMAKGGVADVRIA